MKNETLTDEERHVMARQGGGLWAKALRIINQLTAALEAERAKREQSATDWKALVEAAEARAEALQARVAELEAALAAARGCDPTRCPACYASPGQHYGWCKLDAAEAELATAKARVAELEDENSQMYSAGLNQGERLDAAESELANVRLELAQLNAELARMQRARNDATARAEAFKHERSQTESELADLRGRVKRAEGLLTTNVNGKRVAVSRLARQVLEALRGR